MHGGFAVSLIGHVAVLAVGLLFAGANPFDSVPTEAISVDIVTADEIEQTAREPAPPPDSSKPSETLSPDTLSPAAPAAEIASAPSPAAPQLAPEPTPRPVPEHGTRQAAAQPQPQPLTSVPPPGAPPPPAVEGQEPNITDMFGLPLALPDGRLGGGFDAPAVDKANIASDDITTFHKHLRACLTLPAKVNMTDNVKAVLRIHLKPDGTLAGDPQPILVEGVSKGGGALYQSAVAALRKCQPYNMLPPDRYQEWKVFDLSLTPQNFRRE